MRQHSEDHETDSNTVDTDSVDDFESVDMKSSTSGGETESSVDSSTESVDLKEELREQRVAKSVPLPPEKSSSDAWAYRCDALAHDSLRSHIFYLTTLCIALCLYLVAWSPGVDWFQIEC